MERIKVRESRTVILHLRIKTLKGRESYIVITGFQQGGFLWNLRYGYSS